MSEAVWYENRCIGVNKLGSMMKDLSRSANLSRVYTNHSVRATAITLWSNAGMSNRHIMAISGHRNEQTLQSYNRQPSSRQLQQCNDVLQRALNPSASVQENPAMIMATENATCSTVSTSKLYARGEKYNLVCCNVS